MGGGVGGGVSGLTAKLSVCGLAVLTLRLIKLPSLPDLSLFLAYVYVLAYMTGF